MTQAFNILEGEVEFIFDDEIVVAKVGDTVSTPPNVCHQTKCETGGKIFTTFKNGHFDLYLNRFSELTDEHFGDADFMASLNAGFDIYEE